MELKNYFAQDAEGNAQPSAACYLYNADTTNLVNSLVDAQNQPLTNPFVSDSYGLIQFKAPNGIYDLRVISGNRDYKIRVQAADVTELIDGIDEAVAAADTATTAAELSQSKADIAADAAINAVDARDDAESYAIDVLSSVTEVNNNRILAQQAALDAGNVVQVKVQEFADDLADPTKGAKMVSRSTVAVDSIADLLLTPIDKNLNVEVRGYFTGVSGVGGGLFKWSSTTSKASHNGGTIHSPTVPWGGQVAHADYLNAVGETVPAGSGCWVSVSGTISIWQFGAVKFLNNGTNTTTDSTYAIQKALYAAKRSVLTSTHSISELTTVLCDGGDVRIDGQLVFPEGVVLDGKDKISSRLCFSWGTTTKVVGYGRVYDQQQSNALGTTFTKNWGLKNVSFVPYYPESGPGSCTYIDYLFDIEPMLHSVRFIMHKGAVSGGQLNATAVSFKKCIDPDFIDVTFDGGLNHLYGSDVTYGWGVRTGRFSSIYSYNAKSHAVLFGDGSNSNVIDISVQMPEQVGDNRAVYISGTSSDNVVTVEAAGANLKYGVIVEGSRNRVSGTLAGSVLGADIRGTDNRVDVVLASGVAWNDTGISSELRLSGFSKIAGESKGVKRSISITAGSTWVDVAEVTLTAGAGRSAVVTASGTSEVTGVGRDCYTSTWLVGQSSDGVVTVSEAATPFNPASALKLRIVSNGANKAKLQTSIALGTATTVDVQFTMRADQYARIKGM